MRVSRGVGPLPWRPVCSHTLGRLPTRLQRMPLINVRVERARRFFDGRLPGGQRPSNPAIEPCHHEALNHMRWDCRGGTQTAAS